MPHFFFNVRDALGKTRDEEGLELEGLEAVREEANVAAKEYLASKLDSGAVPTKTDLERIFEVTDESGIVVLTMPFSEAVTQTWRRHSPAGRA